MTQDKSVLYRKGCSSHSISNATTSRKLKQNTRWSLWWRHIKECIVESIEEKPNRSPSFVQNPPEGSFWLFSAVVSVITATVSLTFTTFVLLTYFLLHSYGEVLDKVRNIPEISFVSQTIDYWPNIPLKHRNDECSFCTICNLQHKKNEMINNFIYS